MTGPFVGTTKRCDALQVWPLPPRARDMLRAAGDRLSVG